jgi:hypothetical protein
MCTIQTVGYKNKKTQMTTKVSQEQNLCFSFSASSISATLGDFNAVINVLQVNGLQDPLSHSSKTAMNRSKQSSSFFLMALHA